MKKTMQLILSLALVLMLALTPSLSMAAYGDLTTGLLLRAVADQREINAKFSMQLNEFSVPGLESEDCQKQLAALGDAIATAALNLSAVQIEGGVRIAANAEMQNQQLINGAVEITAEQIAAQTSLLPGKRFVVSMETLKQLAGIPEISPEQIEEALTALEQYAGEAVVRYGAVVMPWLESLTVTENEEPIAETETCDAVVKTVNVSVTGAQLRKLVVDLLDAASGDEKLIAFIDQFAPNTAEAIAAAKSEVEEESEIDALKIDIALGGNAQASLVSVKVNVTMDGEPGGIFYDVQVKTDGNGMICAGAVNASVKDGETDIMTFEYTTAGEDNAQGGQDVTVDATMMISEDDTTVTAEIAAQSKTAVEEKRERMDLDETVRMIIEEEEDGANSRGDLNYDVHATSQIEDLGEDFKMTYEIHEIVNANVDNTPVTMDIVLGIELTSAAYVPSTEAAEEIDVFAMNDETLEAIGTEAEAGLMQMLFTVLSMIPQDALALFIQ